MNDWRARDKVFHYYPHAKEGTFGGTLQQLIGKVCKECFLAFMEYEFLWEEDKICAEIFSYQEEGCQNCDRC